MESVRFEDGESGISIEGSYRNNYGVFKDCPIKLVYLGRNYIYGYSYVEVSPFNNNKEIYNLILGSQVTSLGKNSFSGCTHLNRIINYSSLPLSGSSSSEYGGVTTYASSIYEADSDGRDGDFLFYCKDGQKYLYGYMGMETDIELPFGYQIANSAFRNYDHLKTIDLPEGITEIGDYVFENCSELCRVKLPNSVTYIGKEAFYNTKQLSSVVLGDNLQGIGSQAFYGCNNLWKIVNESIMTISTGSSDNGYISNYAKGIYTADADGQEGDYLYYTKDGQNYIYDYIGTDSNLVIPTGYNIADYAFYDNTQITTIKLPEGMHSIGDYAFYGCLNLTIDELPSSLQSIGNYPFNSKSKTLACQLLFTELPSSLISLGDYAFYNYKGLEEEKMPNALKYIGNYSFYGCSNLAVQELPNSLTSIGDYAFYGCSKLSIQDIPSSLTMIGSNALNGCTSLRAITIPASMKEIKSGAFSGCSNIETVIIEDGTDVLTLADRAFNGLPLKTVYLGRNIKCPSSSYSYSPFYNNSLRSLTIGAYVTTLDYCSFGNNPTKTIWLANTPPSYYSSANGQINYVANTQYSSLRNMKVYDLLSSIFVVNGVRYAPTSLSGMTCDAIDCIYDESAENIYIGESVTYKRRKMIVNNVNDYTCYDNDYINSIIVAHDGPIGNYAFYDCDQALTAETGENISSIGNSAFYSCDALKSTAVKSEVACTIGSSAFSSCKSLLTAELETGVKRVGSSAFSSCTALKTAILKSTIPCVIEDGAFSSCSSLTRAELGPATETIQSRVFSNCTSLPSIVIPDATATIGTYCFDHCTSLVDVHIGSGLSILPEYLFNYCTALPIIKIPDNVNKISNNVFIKCSSLARLIIKDRTTTLDLGYNSNNSSSNNRALFNDCALDYAYIGGKITYNTSSSYSYSPFYRNQTLREVVITDKENQIYDNEFYGCIKLHDVTIGDGVRNIGKWAFSGCASLDHFAFGSSLSQIGQEAFSDCTNVTEILSRAATPPVCGNEALDDINKWICTLYVPKGKERLYGASDQWKEFFTSKNEIMEVLEYDPVMSQYLGTWTSTNKTNGSTSSKTYNFVGNAGDVVFFKWMTSSEEDHDYLTAVLDGEEILKESGEDYVGYCSEALTSNGEHTLTFSYKKDSRGNAGDDECSISELTLYLVRPTVGDAVMLSDAVINTEVMRNMEDVDVCYLRSFSNTDWQALYVPFTMNYVDWANDFEVARLNNVHQYDLDGDGTAEETELEVVMMSSGSKTEANVPYLIRALESGDKALTTNGSSLVRSTLNSLDCASISTLYRFYGTYQQIDGQTMLDNGYYALGSGSLHPAASANSHLGAYRWYMTITDRNSGTNCTDLKQVKIRLVDNDEEATGIEVITTTSNEELPTYDMQGRQMKRELQQGLYIRGGQKVMIK